MGGAASILLWCAAVRRPQAWSARRSGALVWACPSAATPAGAGGWGRWGGRCAGPAASPPPASRSLLGEGGRPLGSGGAEGCSCGPQAGAGVRVGGGGGGGGLPQRPPSPRPVGRRPAIRCLWRAPPGYTRAVGVAGWPRASGAAWSAANGSVRWGWGREGGGTPPPWFAPPSSPGQPLKGPLRLRPPGRRRSAVGRQRAGSAGACLGRGASAPRVQPPLRGGCGAAVSSVCLRPLLGLRGRGGGVGGALWSSGSAPDGEGGAAWRSRRRGPAVGWGVVLFPRPPLPRVRPSCRPSLGPLVPPAFIARRWPAGGGREG